MKVASLFLIILAGVSILIGVIWRIMVKPFPLGDVQPHALLEVAAVCLLFALTLSVYKIANKP